MTEQDNYPLSFNPTHQLVEVVAPNAGVVLSSEGDSANLTRNTRVVSDRIIFIDNIADGFLKEDFIHIVKQYATRGPIVDVRFLSRTKGGSFAFVEFEVEEDGRDAIAGINCKEYENPSGKFLDLKATKAENPSETVSNKNLYVRGIPRNWTNEDLKARFEGFGSISHVRTLKKAGNDSENTGVGFVHFFVAIDAAKAIEGVDEQLVDPNDESLGRLEVKFARAKTTRQRNRRRRHRRPGGGRGEYGVAPNWNFGRQGGRGGGRGGHGGMRGGRNGAGGGWNMGQNGSLDQYPPNEEMWARMVEVMQNMSLWQQNPYNTIPQNYQYNYNPSVRQAHTTLLNNSENNNGQQNF